MQEYINIQQILNGLEARQNELSDNLPTESQDLLTEISNDLKKLILNQVDLNQALENNQDYNAMDDVAKMRYKSEISTRPIVKKLDRVMNDLEKAMAKDQRLMIEERERKMKGLSDNLKAPFINNELEVDDRVNNLINKKLVDAVISPKLNRLSLLLESEYTEQKLLLDTLLNGNLLEGMDAIRQRHSTLPQTINCHNINNLTGSLYNLKQVYNLTTQANAIVTNEFLQQPRENFANMILNIPFNAFNRFITNLVNCCRNRQRRRNRQRDRNR